MALDAIFVFENSNIRVLGYHPNGGAFSYGIIIDSSEDNPIDDIDLVAFPVATVTFADDLYTCTTFHARTIRKLHRLAFDTLSEAVKFGINHAENVLTETVRSDKKISHAAMRSENSEEARRKSASKRAK